MKNLSFKEKMDIVWEYIQEGNIKEIDKFLSELSLTYKEKIKPVKRRNARNYISIADKTYIYGK